MMRESYWAYATRAGVCAIRFNPLSHRCHTFIGDEDLGNYETLQQAINALVGGNTAHAPSSGADTRDLGLPPNIADWQVVPAGPRGTTTE